MQKTETYLYFNSVPEEWSRKVRDTNYSVMENRNETLFSAIADLLEPQAGQSIVDLGCGTGELVIDAIGRGYSALGVDFSEKMIEKCKSMNESVGARFLCGDITSEIFWDRLEERYNVFSGFGLIEYLSNTEFTALLQRLASRTEKMGGMVVIGSRNRLFNIISANEFTEAEVSLGTIESLIQESIVFSKAHSFESLVIELEKLGGREINLQSHKNTGINVSTRYQYTPAYLVRRLRNFGFNRFRLYPVNCHGILPISIGGDDFGNIRRGFSRLFQKEFLRAWKLIPQSSSFAIAATR